MKYTRKCIRVVITIRFNKERKFSLDKISYEFHMSCVRFTSSYTKLLRYHRSSSWSVTSYNRTKITIITEIL